MTEDTQEMQQQAVPNAVPAVSLPPAVAKVIAHTGLQGSGIGVVVFYATDLVSQGCVAAHLSGDITRDITGIAAIALGWGAAYLIKRTTKNA